MRVLITGAAGFIGSHLTDRYLADGHNVLGVDNLLTGSKANISKAMTHERFQFIEADIVDRWDAVEKAVGDSLPELILHFASPASPVDYGNHPFETLEVNAIGTKHCADAALRWNAKIVYASTSESYGDPLEHPQRESYWGHVNPVGPRSCYDESKRFGEAYVSTSMRIRQLRGTILRIFNTYGPRMRHDDGRVVPNFIMQALRGEPLTVYGNGKQTRSFCYVDDLIEGIVRTAVSNALQGTVVNLGNPEERTIEEFAREVARLANVAFNAVYRPMPPDDPGRRCPNIDRARTVLGWEPKVKLEEGLRRTIEAFRATNL